MDIAPIQKLMDLLKSILVIAAMLTSIVAVWTRFDQILGLIRDMAGNVTVEVAGAKLEFTADNIGTHFPTDFANALKNSSYKANVITTIQEMDPRMVQRLLHLGLSGNLCDFENATSAMLEDYAADVRLTERGLVTREASDDVMRQVSALADQAKAENREWLIGSPRSCYTLKLTSLGYDVRTGIVSVVAATFVPPTPSHSPQIVKAADRPVRAVVN